MHERLSPPQQVAHLRTQFAIVVPAQDNGFEAEQGLCDVAMRRSRLRSIECLQGAQVQQSGTGGRPHGRDLRRMAFQGLCLFAVPVELTAKPRSQRHGAHIGTAILQSA